MMDLTKLCFERIGVARDLDFSDKALFEIV